jgi:hypothetical protein
VRSRNCVARLRLSSERTTQVLTQRKSNAAFSAVRARGESVTLLVGMISCWWRAQLVGPRPVQGKAARWSSSAIGRVLPDRRRSRFDPNRTASLAETGHSRTSSTSTDYTIMDCVDVCPKGLNLTEAVTKTKDMLVRRVI